MSIEDEIKEIKDKIKEMEYLEIEEHIDWYNKTVQPHYDFDSIWDKLPDCKVKVARVTDRAKYPSYAHRGDACFDLSVLVDKEFVPKDLWNGTDYIPEVDWVGCDGDLVKTFYVDIPPHCEAVFTTGLKFEIPEGYSMKVYPRSSTGIKKGLALSNGTGIIDENYRGEIFVALVNQTNSTVRVYDGDRLAQAEIVKNLNVQLNWVEVEDLSDSERGEGGIGSSGDK